MKIEKKTKGFIPYTKYTHRVGRYKYESDIYEYGGGEFVAKNGNDNNIIHRADGTLEDWIRDIQNRIDFERNTMEFLLNIKEKRDKK